MGKAKTASGSLRVAEIVLKLYEMRDFVKRVNPPEEYLSLVRAWADRIRAQMASARQTNMEAMISLLKQNGESTYSAWIQAAYVEMTEGCLVDDEAGAGVPPAAMTEQPEERDDDMGESGLAGMTVTIMSNGRKVTMPADEFGDVARRRAARINAGIERSESEMDQERVDGADVPKDDGEQKIIRVCGRLEKITMPTERGKELQLAVVLANNGDNRLALAMMDGASVAIEAVERDETPAAKPTAPGECDDQLPLFDMDGDPDEGDVGSEEDDEEASEAARAAGCPA